MSGDDGTWLGGTIATGVSWGFACGISCVPGAPTSAASLPGWSIGGTAGVVKVGRVGSSGVRLAGRAPGSDSDGGSAEMIAEPAAAAGGAASGGASTMECAGAELLSAVAGAAPEGVAGATSAAVIGGSSSAANAAPAKDASSNTSAPTAASKTAIGARARRFKLRASDQAPFPVVFNDASLFAQLL